MSRTTITEAERQEAMFKRISPAKAGKMLGMSATSVRALIEDGELEARDYSRKDSKIPRYRIDPAAVEAFDNARIVKKKAS